MFAGLEQRRACAPRRPLIKQQIDQMEQLAPRGAPLSPPCRQKGVTPIHRVESRQHSR
jgi:hypothetical protein